MSLGFPSPEFDEAVADVLHGRAEEARMRAVNELLRANPAARDEYLFRVELHSRLASDPDLFASAQTETATSDPLPKLPHRPTVSERDSGPGAVRPMGQREPPPAPILRPRFSESRKWVTAVAAAASVAFLLALGLGLGRWIWSPNKPGSTSTAIAVLAHAVDAEWSRAAELHPAGSALDPGWLKLKSGLVQVVFYSGARVVIEGPAELQLVSSREAFCRSGLLSAEVPAQARGFRINTPQTGVVDLGTAFGLRVGSSDTEVHVFKGEVEVGAQSARLQGLKEGDALEVDQTGMSRSIPADPSLFARASDLLRNSRALQVLRYGLWKASNTRLNSDPSLLVHLDFEGSSHGSWTVHNAADHGAAVPDGTIVGCDWTEGRWPGKKAIGFGTISDRVRLMVPDTFSSLTLAAWVNVKGLDRAFNSLFMADGFDAGEVHWQIRNNGSIDLGVRGQDARGFQVFLSPPVIGLDRLGQWIHLAAVIDGRSHEATLYLNGDEVSRETMKVLPPFRIGPSELGNWNVDTWPNVPPASIRHFSGSMDEFALFNRALRPEEIRRLFIDGNPNTGP